MTGDPPSLAVRLVVDPLRDQIVRVFDPKSRRSLLLTEANCKKFVADIDFGGSMVNGVREMKVTLDLDCKTPGGDFVVGRASNDHCL